MCREGKGPAYRAGQPQSRLVDALPTGDDWVDSSRGVRVAPRDCWGHRWPVASPTDSTGRVGDVLPSETGSADRQPTRSNQHISSGGDGLLVILLVGYLGIVPVGYLGIVLFARAEQPRVNVIDHSAEPFIVDAVPIILRHRVINVAHNRVHRDLIASLPCHRLERVTQSVEANLLAADFVGQRLDAYPLLGNVLPDFPQVSRLNAFHGHVAAENPNQSLAGIAILVEGSPGDFSGIDHVLLERQKLVGQVPNRQPI